MDFSVQIVNMNTVFEQVSSCKYSGKESLLENNNETLFL